MLKLVSGAACAGVYGGNKSPKESCFVTFAKTWQQINKTNLKLPRFSSTLLKRLQKETVVFITSFLYGERTTLTDDFKELALIALMYIVVNISQ